MTKIKNILLSVLVFSLMGSIPCHAMIMITDAVGHDLFSDHPFPLVGVPLDDGKELGNFKLVDVPLYGSVDDADAKGEEKGLLLDEKDLPDYNKIMRQWNLAIHNGDVRLVNSLARHYKLYSDLYYTDACSEFRTRMQNHLVVRGAKYRCSDPMTQAIVYACYARNSTEDEKREQAKRFEIVKIVHGAGKFRMHNEYPCWADTTCCGKRTWVRGSAITFVAVSGNSELLLLLLRLKDIRLTDGDAFIASEFNLTEAAQDALKDCPGYEDCAARESKRRKSLDDKGTRKNLCQAVCCMCIPTVGCLAGLFCFMGL